MKQLGRPHSLFSSHALARRFFVRCSVSHYDPTMATFLKARENGGAACCWLQLWLIGCVDKSNGRERVKLHQTIVQSAGAVARWLKLAPLIDSPSPSAVPSKSLINHQRRKTNGTNWISCREGVIRTDSIIHFFQKSSWLSLFEVMFNAISRRTEFKLIGLDFSPLTFGQQIAKINRFNYTQSTCRLSKSN